MFPCFEIQINLSFQFTFIDRTMQNIGHLYSGVVFNQLLTCVLFVALALFSLDQSVELDANLIMAINCLIEYVVLCLVYCYYSETVSQASFDIGGAIYDSSWYTLTIMGKKMIILMIRKSQKKFRFNGFGIVDCSPETFLSVRSDFNKHKTIQFNLLIKIKFKNSIF